jgi:protein-S-isoprenylcysteine O-methyltransferase Ste14
MRARVWWALAATILVMAAMIFAAAGTLDYWQAWLFLALYTAVAIAITLDLARRDPALLERRMRGGPAAEKEPAQRVIMTITSAGFVAAMVVPGLDHRFGWSQMPGWAAVLGDALMVSGWIGIWFVFRANSFAAATIEVARDQRVISTGPYAVVRHPMYAAALPMLFGIPVALGSWWGMLAIVALLPALAWRALDEERLLVRDLPGYAEYRRKVRYRLVPLIW